MENYGRLLKTIPKTSNSMTKFVQEFSDKRSDGELDRVKEILPLSNTTAPSLFPSISKLSLKRPPLKLAPIFNKENFPRNSKKKQSLAGVPSQSEEIEYLPIPKKKPLLTRSQSVHSTESTKPITLSKNPEREQVIITGSVQYVLKNFKMYPELKALYEVYGNLIKITKSKTRFEYSILMRTGSGPILQGVYFDFENVLMNSEMANFARCIGHFNRENRFHIHKMEQIQVPPQEPELTRIQNVSTFALLQYQNGQFK